MTYRVYFNGYDTNGLPQLWVTDGTTEGTSEFANVAGAFSYGLDPTYITALTGTTLFNGTDDNGNQQLWSVSGTTVTELSASYTFDLAPTDITAFGTGALFEGTDSSGLQQLWVTDGTAIGTTEVTATQAGSIGVDPSDITTLANGVALFNGYVSSDPSSVGLAELYAYDGTNMTVVTAPGANSSGLSPTDITAFGTGALFFGLDQNVLEGLWFTDGTTATELQATTSPPPTGITVLGTIALFDDGNGQLAETDGQTVNELTNVANLQPTDITAFGTQALFAGTDINGLSGLWITDGTPNGTQELVAGPASVGGLNPTDITVFGTQALFSGVDSFGNTELWITDGTSQGTTEIIPADDASTGLAPNDITVIGTQALFNGTDASDNQQLWVTNGTPSGTIPLNSDDLIPSDLTVAGSTAATLSLSAPATATVGVGQLAPIGPVSLAASDVTSDDMFTVTLTDTSGVLAASGALASNGGRTIVLMGSLAQVNAELATLTDIESSAGTDTIAVDVADQNGSHAPETKIAVTVNGLPVIAAPASVEVGQNQSTSVVGVSLSETGITTGENFTVKLSDGSGMLSASGAGVSGSGTANLTITGSLAQINTDLTTLSDTDATTSADTIALTASDSFGNIAVAGAIGVSVLGFHAPASVGAGQGKPVVIGVSLVDANAANGETFVVSLSDTTGLLSVTPGSTTGATVSGSGSTQLILSGSLAQVNAELASLTDTANTPGSDTIQLNAQDSLKTTTAAAIAVNVAAAPTITAPVSATLGQNQKSLLGGVSVAESGSTSGETFTVTLSDSTGDLSATGPGVSGSGTTTLVITGSLSQVNADLLTLADTDGTAGADTIKVNAVDPFANAAPVASIAVTVNGAPVIAAPASLAVGQGQPVFVSGVSLSETGNTSDETFTVTLSDTNGSLSATGTGVSGSGTTSLAITGSLTQVNAALASLSDTDTTIGADTIKLTASDGFGNTAVAQSIAVTASGRPAFTAPSSIVLGVNQAMAISSVSLSEPSAVASETYTATLTDTSGLLSATLASGAGAGVAGNGTTSLTLTGSLAQVDAELASLSDTDATAGTDTITLNARDSLNNTAPSANIAVAVDGLPSITAPLSVMVNQGQAFQIKNVSLSETPSSTGESFSVVLSDTAGLLSATAMGAGVVSGAGTEQLTLSGSLSDVNAELATLTDTDSAAASDSITLKATDSLGNTGLSSIGVSVNTTKPSKISGAVSGQQTTDEQAIKPFVGVTITDGNPASPTETVTITPSTTANGVLSDPNAPSDGGTLLANGSYKITGSAASVSTAIDALVFTPLAHEVAPANSVTTGFTISDTNSASITTTDTATTVIATAVNDTPVISGTSTSGIATTDAASIAPFAHVTISDPDFGASETISIDELNYVPSNQQNPLIPGFTNGILSGTGLIQTTSPGVYTLSGSPSLVTKEIDALSFTPTPHQTTPGQSITTDFIIVATQNGSTAYDGNTSVIATAVASPITLTATVSNLGTIGHVQTLEPFSNVIITDPNAGETETATVTLTNPSAGKLSLPGGSSNGVSLQLGNAGTYTLSAASAASVDSALDALVFTPAAGSTAFDLTVKDTSGQMAGENTGTVVVDPGPVAKSVSSSVKLGGSIDLTSAMLGTPGIAGDSLTITADGTANTLGSVSLVNGALVYTATGTGLSDIPANGTKTDSFTYTISDKYGDTASGSVTVSVSNAADYIYGGIYGGSTINGTPGADIITAYGWNNIINDNGGNDIVYAGQGQATVNASTGNVQINLNGYFNSVTGQDGNDTVSGALGNTTISLGNGNDSVEVGGYFDIVTLGNGNDTVTGPLGNSTITLGTGIDVVDVTGYDNVVKAGSTTGTDYINAGLGNETISGGNGNFVVLAGGYGDMVTLGNGNNDVFTTPSGVSNPSLPSGTAVPVEQGNATVTTGSGNDTIVLTGYGNLVNAGGGMNFITGGTGLDNFVLPTATGAGAGMDTISNFKLTNGDVLNLANALLTAGWTDNNPATLGNYLKVSESGGNAMIGIATHGSGAVTTIAQLNAVSNLTLATLQQHAIL